MHTNSFIERHHYKSALHLLPLLIFLVFCLPFADVFAQQQSRIYFKSGNSVVTGSIFSVSLLLDAKEPVNAVDLEINYPKDKLEFVGFNNAGSILDIWQLKPTILAGGNISMSGGMLKPFTGDAGLAIRLSFKSIKSGSAELSIIKNDVYSANGQGTRLPISSPSYKFSILEKTEKIDIPKKDNTVSVPAKSEAPQLQKEEDSKDTTPPDLLFEATRISDDGPTLLVFNATDFESGIKKTEMRIKKWWSYSPWKEVENPRVYEEGTWRAEVKAVNNEGLETVKSISWKGELIKKIFYLILGLAFLVFIVTRVYNMRRSL